MKTNIPNFNLWAVCPLMLQALYNNVVERAKPIEAVNVDGGRFIREAKVRFMFMLWGFFVPHVCVCVLVCLKFCQRISEDFGVTPTIRVINNILL